MTSSRPAKPHTPGTAMPRDRQPPMPVRCWLCGDTITGYQHICQDCQENLCKPNLGERLYREKGE